MKAEYKRDLQNNYLILEIAEDDEESSYRIRMAEQNKITGLLPFHSSRKDGVLQLYYEITSMQSLESSFERKSMGYQDIVFVLSGIRNTLEELQKYLLNPSQIVFDARYVFFEPGRQSIELCYIPGKQNDAPITMLAEYILKKLDHEDQQAVTIGYGFYQKTLEENFSLQKALRDILPVANQNNVQENRHEKSKRTQGQERGREESKRVQGQERGREESGRILAQERSREESGRARAQEMQAEQSAYGNLKELSGYQAKYEEDRCQENRGNCHQENRDTYEVIHKERKKRSRKNMGKLFEVVHPTVLLSGLFLVAVLEIVYYFGYLNLTETGGLFFLLISVEMLINRYWRNTIERRRQEENRWVQEEDDEMYQLLQEEMYEMPQRDVQIEETRCLVPDSDKGGLQLVCILSDSLNRYPDITVAGEVVCIGKIKGESDVILDSPTVSRIHARIFYRNNSYYIKDLNSRNGTSCNGERLHPQEERQLSKGDIIAFAEIEYRVTGV